MELGEISWDLVGLRVGRSEHCVPPATVSPACTRTRTRLHLHLHLTHLNWRAGAVNVRARAGARAGAGAPGADSTTRRLASHSAAASVRSLAAQLAATGANSNNLH